MRRRGLLGRVLGSVGATLGLVAIPAGHVIYAAAGLVIFGGFTIADFNRLRHEDDDSAVLIAAGIFLDVFNVFLLLLDRFGGSRDQATGTRIRALDGVRVRCAESDDPGAPQPRSRSSSRTRPRSAVTGGAPVSSQRQ